jgi:hypothetical protein
MGERSMTEGRNATVVSAACDGVGRRMTRNLMPALLVAILGATALACASGATTAPEDEETQKAIAALREATRPFQDLAAAVRAGYVAEVADCIVHEHHGAMGYHHINRSYIERDISVTRPQLLLYERMPDGEYRLNGVEFFIPYKLWPRDSDPPVFMGQTMKPEDTFEYWYLHVWAWRENPDGIFADFHPDVQCPDDGRKVYRPNPEP